MLEELKSLKSPAVSELIEIPLSAVLANEYSGRAETASSKELFDIFSTCRRELCGGVFRSGWVRSAAVLRVNRYYGGVFAKPVAMTLNSLQ